MGSDISTLVSVEQRYITVKDWQDNEDSMKENGFIPTPQKSDEPYNRMRCRLPEGYTMTQDETNGDWYIIRDSENKPVYYYMAYYDYYRPEVMLDKISDPEDFEKRHQEELAEQQRRLTTPTALELYREAYKTYTSTASHCHGMERTASYVVKAHEELTVA